MNISLWVPAYFQGQADMSREGAHATRNLQLGDFK